MSYLELGFYFMMHIFDLECSRRFNGNISYFRIKLTWFSFAENNAVDNAFGRNANIVL